MRRCIAWHIGRSQWCHARCWTNNAVASFLIVGTCRRTCWKRVHQRMVGWATERFGSLDTELRSEREFLLSVHQFPAAER